MSGRAEQDESDLRATAARLGLSPTYTDARGQEVLVPDATLRALIEILSPGAGVGARGVTSNGPAPVAPEQAHQGADPTAQYWLLAVQLYAVHSRRNWGHGDFGDLDALLELAAELGAAGIGLNPLHALLHDSETDVSPYSPSSRLYLNFLYIDVEALPEFASIHAEDLLPRIEMLRKPERIDYGSVAEIKEVALRRCFERFCSGSGEQADFADFRAAHGPPLHRFARFEAARHGRGEDESEIRFHEYVQWQADRQLRACRDKAHALDLPVGLYLDLAVGVRGDGADAHAEKAVYLHGASVGAPPDLLNVNGQNWGLTTYRPDALEQQAFKPFRRMLAANMQYAGALRLDHVLWLNRLYLIPEGMKATAGCYLRYPLEPLLAALSAESNVHRCIVIGEDLGTVPPDLRAELRRWGVWTYHVMQFERGEEGEFKDADGYQERALATFSTHDLPPFAAWMSGSDLVEKSAIGVDPGESAEARSRAWEFLRSLLSKGEDGTRSDFLSVAAFLARTPSRLVAVGLEDALGLTQMTNVPGTTVEHPNWRLRLPVPLEELRDDSRLTGLAEVFAGAGRASRTRKLKGRPGS